MFVENHHARRNRQKTMWVKERERKRKKRPTSEFNTHTNITIQFMSDITI